MRYENKRKSGNDKDVDVYNFVFGIEEARLLKEILNDLHKRMPKLTENQIVRSRLSNMRKVMEKFFVKHKNNKL